MAQIFTKDPDAVLDFAFDWSSWLATGETISSHTVTVETGITKDSDSESSGVVTVWLSGGSVGERYDVECEITTNTSPSRKDERTMIIKVEER
jgi:hypothetical protein